MILFGDTQESLAAAMNLALSTLNAKINNYRGSCFHQSEIAFIKERYNLTGNDIDEIFFANEMS